MPCPPLGSSLWSALHTSHPHTLVIDLGAAREISGVRLLSRQDSPNGRSRTTGSI
jgi:hypothetical protein